jgi:aspartate/tyrosine/aromatic aminotransferase
LIAAGILTKPENRKQWLDELGPVVKRMNDMRAALRAALEKKQVPGDWSHITT